MNKKQRQDILNKVVKEMTPSADDYVKHVGKKHLDELIEKIDNVNFMMILDKFIKVEVKKQLKKALSESESGKEINRLNNKAKKE
jgi:hypothetical protein